MLFKDSIKLAEFAQIGSVKFPAVKATIQAAEDQHLIPILGRTQYSTLVNAYRDAATEDLLSTSQKALLDACRKAVAPFTAYYYSVKVDGQISDSGFRRDETNTAKTAYQYQLANFREANLQEAEAGIENLIGFLEANKSDYPEWTSSNEYLEYQSLFIKTASDFNLQFSSGSPFRNYWAMRGKMFDVEEITIRKFLGSAYFDVLKVKDRAATMTLKEKILLKDLKKAIANLTVAASVPFLNVRINESGLTVATVAPRANSDQLTARSGADSKSIDLLINSCLSAGSTWLKHAGDFMKEYKTDFNVWPGNTIHCSPVNINCEERGVYGL